MKNFLPMTILVGITLRESHPHLRASVRCIQQFAAFDGWSLPRIPHRQFIHPARDARHIHRESIPIRRPSFRKHPQSLAARTQRRQRRFITHTEIIPHTNLQRVRNDFGVGYESTQPPLGSRSQGLRMLSETWTADRNTFTMDVAGVAGGVYELTVWNPGQTPSVEGGELLDAANGSAKVRVRFPSGNPDEYVHGKIVFHFSGVRETRGKSRKPAA